MFVVLIVIVADFFPKLKFLLFVALILKVAEETLVEPEVRLIVIGIVSPSESIIVAEVS